MPQNGYFDSEDPDEMPHNVAFHQGLHCLLRQNRSSNRGKYTIFDPSIYTMGHTYFYYMLLCLKRVKVCRL